jgi:hypothetical protein
LRPETYNSTGLENAALEEKVDLHDARLSEQDQLNVAGS